MHFYGFSHDELPEMEKLLPVAHEQLKKAKLLTGHRHGQCSIKHT